MKIIRKNNNKKYINFNYKQMKKIISYNNKMNN